MPTRATNPHNVILVSCQLLLGRVRVSRPARPDVDVFLVLNYLDIEWIKEYDAY